jgi:alanine dehydrogenase
MSSTPVLLGDWLNAGCHLDLVGAFTPAMREADDVAISQARVFVDTMVGALTEAGDILQPIASGVLSESDIEADLFSLCRGFDMHRADDDITLFKSVGHALEDLVSAAAVYETLAQHPR